MMGIPGGKQKTDETRLVESVLKQTYPVTEVYRQNFASIRVKVVDVRFAGKTTDQRIDMLAPYIDELPEAIRSDLIFFVLRTPAEIAPGQFDIMNQEFEHPHPSRL